MHIFDLGIFPANPIAQEIENDRGLFRAFPSFSSSCSEETTVHSLGSFHTSRQDKASHAMAGFGLVQETNLRDLVLS